jgi:hypothetical protein
MMPESRRLNDLNTVQPNYSDMQCPINKRDVNNSAPEISKPFKRPETAQKWGVRD